MSVLRRWFPFAIRWSSGELEGTRVAARDEEDAESRLRQELERRSLDEPWLGRPCIVPPCLLSRLELDHVELDWQRAS